MRVTLNYSPLPKQRALHEDRATVRLFRGGVGSGKTRAGAAEAKEPPPGPLEDRVFAELDRAGVETRATIGELATRLHAEAEEVAAVVGALYQSGTLRRRPIEGVWEYWVPRLDG